MSRHISGEQRREKQKFTSGNKLGFRYDEESIKQSEKLALDLIKAGTNKVDFIKAWTNILNRPDLLMNISSELKSLEGGYNLAIQVENMASEMTSEYVPLQEKTMRIRGSELRKIIKEELRRSMLNEASTKTFKASVLLDDLDDMDRTGKSYEGDLLLNTVTPKTAFPGFTVDFVSKEGTTFELDTTSRLAAENKEVPGKITFVSKHDVEVTYTV